MSFSRRSRRQARRATLALGCCALMTPSAASADKIGDTPADFGRPVARSLAVPPASSPRAGDTPADFPGSLAVARASDPRAGDTPADFPGASRAPQFEAPRTIQVVRPERTVVRDVDGTLPIALSGAALLLAVGGVGIALVRTRTARRSLAH
jgi:hypothetical protein